MTNQHVSDSASWIAPAGGTLGAVAYATQGASGNWETELLFALHCVIGAVLGLLVRYSTRWVEGRLKRGSRREGAPAPGFPGGNGGFIPANGAPVLQWPCPFTGQPMPCNDGRCPYCVWLRETWPDAAPHAHRPVRKARGTVRRNGGQDRPSGGTPRRDGSTARKHTAGHYKPTRREGGTTRRSGTPRPSGTDSQAQVPRAKRGTGSGNIIGTQLATEPITQNHHGPRWRPTDELLRHTDH